MKKMTSKRFWMIVLLATVIILIYKLVNVVPALWLALWKLAKILSPFIGGLVVAFLLYRPCDLLEKQMKKCRWGVIAKPARVWSLLAVYLAFFALIALAAAVVVPLITEGVTGLVKSLPAYYESANKFLSEHANDGLFAIFNVSDAVSRVYTSLTNWLTVENIVGSLSGLLSITSSFLNVLIAFIISVYMLSGREKLLSNMRRLITAILPEKGAHLITHYGSRAAGIFSRYIYSMLIDALCICIMVIPGMYISGIPYPLAFAVFIGVANLIPYFGALVSGAVSVLVLVLGGHWGMALFLAIYVLVAQQIDGNILQPRIFGQSVGIEPIYVLLAITVGGGIGGFVGMLIGVPVTAVVKLLVSDFIIHRDYVKRQKKQAEAEEEA